MSGTIEERSNCEGCDLEFDASELNANGLCKPCALEFQGFEDVIDDDDDDDLEDPDLEP